MDPMLGTVGVAPAAGEVRSSLVPDTFGGNMDTPEMRAGATCYLGVNVPGALFSVGDGHYRQGEGEACGTAVEGAMDVTLIVDLIKGGGPAWPRLETDDHLIVVGSSRPLEDAWRVSQVGMVTWLSELYGLDKLDAYQLLSQTSETPLANVVDANYSAVTKVAKALRPAGGGVRRHAPAATGGRRGRRSVRRHQVDLGLQGRRALVTGGTRGIGRAIVETLAAEGAAVGFCARTGSDVTDAVEVLTKNGCVAIGRVVNVADAAGLQQWVDDSAAELGGLDIVVANVSALAIPDEPANWQASFDDGHDGHSAAGQRRLALPGTQRCRVDRHDRQRVRPGDRLRGGPVRHVQGGHHPLHPRAGLPARGQGHPSQLTVSRQHLFRRRCLAEHRAAQP